MVRKPDERGGSHRSQKTRPSGSKSRRDKEARKAEKRRLSIKEKGKTRHLSKPLGEGSYIVFDIESTGGNPDRNGITEIFALKVIHGKVTDSFYSMVNPQVRIPPIVRRMTGITNQMVRDAPTIDVVMPNFVDFIQDHVLVSHNTIGDMKFLRYFSDATTGKMISNYYLCTHLLTEKLLPDAPDKSLKGLAENLGLSFQGDPHRAEADTYFTHELFKILLSELQDLEIINIIDAIRFQGDYESSLRLGWGIAAERLTGLPSSPGVFYLHDRKGDVVFLSGAQDIASEVRSLSRVSYLPKQLTKAVLGSVDISYQISNAMFPASLQEARGLATYDVRYKPSDWHQRVAQFVFVKKEAKDQYLLSTGPLEPGVTIALGPIRSGREIGPFLEKVADIMGKKHQKRGVKLNRTEARIIESFLSGGIASTWSIPLFPLLLVMKSYREKWHRESEQINDLKSLRFPAELKPLRNLSGVIGVPTHGGWELFTIAAGIPENKELFEGVLDKASLEKEGRRHALQVAKQAKLSFKRPLTAWEAHASNRVFWWIQGSKNNETIFITLDHLI